MICVLCPRHCDLAAGQTGFCGARINDGTSIVCHNYGRVTSLALDPVEKKPLRRFFPGSKLLSVGSYGCNLSCPFCQNHTISMSRSPDGSRYISPKELVGEAVRMERMGCIGLAFTYNEPLIGYEYVRDCCLLARDAGLKTVAVTNGCICEQPFSELLPLLDALNIDLKAFTQRFYDAVGGDLETVKRSIAMAARVCHVEVTTLVIPGENDSDSEMDELAAYIASIDRSIPLHLSRFFPRWRMADRQPTPPSTLYRLAHVAGRRLDYVYVGNV